MSSIIWHGMSDVEGAASSYAPPHLHFGGPDRSPRLLRNVLQARVDAMPAGGEICWSTYYFRDRNLAQALIAASDRGVRVLLHVEGQPRRASVNHAVIAMLRAHGLNGGLHVHVPRFHALSPLHGHLHSKIYYFSHPEPCVLVGSFNPSGDIPEDQEVIDEIGDQDRGHNLLAEITELGMARAFRANVLGLSRPVLRLRLDQNRPVKGEQATVWFYPRLSPAIIDRHINSLRAGDVIRGAVSHLKRGFLTDKLIKAARIGVKVHLIVHDTERRVPAATITALKDAGVEIVRYVHPERLPIHAKFLLIDEQTARTAYFGSFNYNPRSRFLNNEVLLASRHDAIYGGLSQRFDEIAAELEQPRS